MLLADGYDLDSGRRARSLAAALDITFDFGLTYVEEKPVLDPGAWDLLYVFGLQERWHRRFGFEPKRVLKEIGAADLAGLAPGDVEQFVQLHGHDADTLVSISRHVQDLVKPTMPRVRRYPVGVEAPLDRHGPKDLSQPLRFATIGALPPMIAWRLRRGAWLREFELEANAARKGFSGIDVVIVGPGGDEQPLAVTEAAANGSFLIVCGAPSCAELVVNGVTGLNVKYDPGEIARAIAWCQGDPDGVRYGGMRNGERIIETLSIDEASSQFGGILWECFSRVGSIIRASLLPGHAAGHAAGHAVRSFGMAPHVSALARLARAAVKGQLPRNRKARILCLGCGPAEIAALRAFGFSRIEAAIEPESRGERLAIGHLVDRAWPGTNALLPGWFGAVVAGNEAGVTAAARFGIRNPVRLA